MPTPSSEAVLYPSPIPMGDPVELKILNPLEYPGWDELLLTNENYSFFHTSAWARVLSESYKYKPLYFTSIEDGELSALIPIMEIKSLLTGRRGVSLPFTDFCQPIVSDRAKFKEMITRIVEYGIQASWKYIEWRGGESYFQGIEPSLSYYGHTLALMPEEHKIFAGFRDSTKRSIKKSMKQGVNVKISNSLESVKAFYRLNCITRKRHGLPPQPFLFFKKVFEHVISRNLGFVALAYHSKRVIASAIYFIFGDKAIYKYGASDGKFLHLRPNNLVMWEAIKWSAQNGFKSFNLGRTELENDGLLQFKRGWGTKQQNINYYKYDLANQAYSKNNYKVDVFSGLFRKMPTPFLNVLGFLFYRHMG